VGRRTPEERYKARVCKQRKLLEEFAAREIEWAEDLVLWFRARGRDMPDEVYRGVAFFKNKEFRMKPGSLTLLYLTYGRLMEELPEAAKEIAFDLLVYRFKVYAEVLKRGGYDGGKGKGNSVPDG
jgi:hypothetical protein